jgi:hypothetical protein
MSSGALSRGRLDITPEWDDIQTCIITCWAISYEARFNDLLPAYDRMRLGRLGAANCHEGDNECKLGVPVAGK